MQTHAEEGRPAQRGDEEGSALRTVMSLKRPQQPLLQHHEDQGVERVPGLQTADGESGHSCALNLEH